MIYGLVTGPLVGDPQRRESAKGTTFATASIRSGSGDDTVFVNIVAFSEQAERLLQLRKGDGISASGRLELRSWTTKDGAERQNLSVIASEIAAARARLRSRDGAPRQRSAYRAAQRFNGGPPNAPPLDDRVDDLYAEGAP